MNGLSFLVSDLKNTIKICSVTYRYIYSTAGSTLDYNITIFSAKIVYLYAIVIVKSYIEYIQCFLLSSIRRISSMMLVFGEKEKKKT